MEKQTENVPLVGPIDIETLNWDVAPMRDDYRELPVRDGFNWQKLVSEVVEFRGDVVPDYYLVAFRSTKLPDAGLTETLETLDRESLAEAKNSLPGALLHYFADTVDETTGKAVSWCLWTDQDSARQAIYSPIHTQAIRAARNGQLYENYDVERYSVRWDESGDVVFDPVPQTLEATNDNTEPELA